MFANLVLATLEVSGLLLFLGRDLWLGGWGSGGRVVGLGAEAAWIGGSSLHGRVSFVRCCCRTSGGWIVRSIDFVGGAMWSVPSFFACFELTTDLRFGAKIHLYL